jgi:hypothetical protein
MFVPQSWFNQRKEEQYLTCFNEMGKVIFPQNSRLLTISLHISLHDLHTAAQATTCLRLGQVLSLVSNLLITSRRSSGGRLAHRLFCITGGWSCNSWTELRDFPLSWPGSLTSKLRLDKLPNPSLTSRIILRKDISSNTATATELNMSPKPLQE